MQQDADWEARKRARVLFVQSVINIPAWPDNENAFWQASLAANELNELILYTANDPGNFCALGRKWCAVAA